MARPRSPSERDGGGHARGRVPDDTLASAENGEAGGRMDLRV